MFVASASGHPSKARNGLFKLFPGVFALLWFEHSGKRVDLELKLVGRGALGSDGTAQTHWDLEACSLRWRHGGAVLLDARGYGYTCVTRGAGQRCSSRTMI